MKKTSGFLLLVILLPLWGCQTLFDAAAGIKAERKALVPVEDVALVVESPATTLVGQQLVLMARGGDNALIPVICTGFNDERCRKFDAGSRIWLNEAISVKCAIEWEEITYSRCYEPKPGDIRGAM